MTKKNSTVPRRQFLATASAGAAAFSIIGCKKTVSTLRRSSGVFVGEGDYRYEVINDCVSLPDKYSWQITHNVAVDRDGFLYVIHEGDEALPEHPAIFVFDPAGQFVRAFGSQFQGGGHGLEVRAEGNQQFLYVTGYQKLKTFAKLTLDGEQVWSQKAPLDSGVYPADENTKTVYADRTEFWGRDHFLPTNFAFLPDGGFFVADGYGSFMIHRFDKDANYVSSFGGDGKEDGQFRTPHGLWIDTRGDESQIVVADRANGRLQWFSLEGQHCKTLDGFILPANIDQLGDTLLVPDLSARITLLDKDNNLIHLGEDPDWREEVLKDKKAMRSGPKENWVAGKFVHPHDACFTPEGDIYVAEWVATGRVSKLQRVS
tara:strand:- start:4412 stop:5530 length:1119 start_codon:yes stop_codon:yes gene_type:complete